MMPRRLLCIGGANDRRYATIERGQDNWRCVDYGFAETSAAPPPSDPPQMTERYDETLYTLREWHMGPDGNWSFLADELMSDAECLWCLVKNYAAPDA